MTLMTDQDRDQRAKCPDGNKDHVEVLVDWFCNHCGKRGTICNTIHDDYYEGVERVCHACGARGCGGLYL